MNRLFYGDNLDVLHEHAADSSVDLVYLDPPFNSARSYNVVFAKHSPDDVQAQTDAFEDTWTWDYETEQTFHHLIHNPNLPGSLSEAVLALHSLLGESDAMAYIVMMAPRLAELRRVLKPTGSLYLHCDPTMSHYLKVLLDAVFGPERFRSEITWVRTSAHSNATVNYASVADILLYYGKGQAPTWNPPFVPLSDAHVTAKYTYREPDGRLYSTTDMRNPSRRPNLTYDFEAANGVTYKPHPNGWVFTKERMLALDAAGYIYYPKDPTGRPRLKKYLDEAKGSVMSNVWNDIPPVNSRAAERLGYPTQKPVALLERIITASSNPGDLVLDPFCGCGTTVAAAQKLDRQWVGIDISFVGIDLVDKRLRDTFGEKVRETYQVSGIPRDLAGAKALFQRNAFEFEHWAVSLLNATPNTKQVADQGVDGRIRFLEPGPGNKPRIATALVSVKGGAQINPAMVLELVGAVENQKARMGILVMLTPPTKGMKKQADKAGFYVWPYNNETFPKIRIVTIADLLAGKRPAVPPTLNPYIKAPAQAPSQGTQIAM